ncbi:MAG: DMT family transporter [Burkholderiales bacterium]|nr:DMT family transporter [Burkholderiales bacterium]
MTTLPPLAVLGAGVVVVSTASILIRLAQDEGVDSLTIATVRLGLAAALLLPAALRAAHADLHALRRRDLALALASGVLLAIHFWSWIASLEHTSVASSTILVTTNPLWVALAAALFLHERPGRAAIAGIGLSLLGTLLTFFADAHGMHPGRNPLLGNSLALLGALAASGYLLVGRALRERMRLILYIGLAYGSAAVLLGLAHAFTATPWSGHSSSAWLFMAALALGPQLLGHTAFNYALRHLSATFVALAILGEPIGSTLLAWLLFDERFGAVQMLGFALLLCGIFLAARAERTGYGAPHAASRHGVQ